MKLVFDHSAPCNPSERINQSRHASHEETGFSAQAKGFQQAFVDH
jgi:hypothetical protein